MCPVPHNIRHGQGYKKLMEQNLPGRQLQDIIKLPYITEAGVLGADPDLLSSYLI